MKLERFARIREHRIFRDFSWPAALEEFGRFNLIYGWNGSGKTTLSGLLKLIQTATPADDGQVDFVFDGTVVSHAHLSTTPTLPPVRVFNRETVARGVFEITDNSLAPLPPVYVFGEESAEKQSHADALKAQLPSLTDAAKEAARAVTKATTDLNAYATDRAREIKNLLVAPGGDFNNYNAANFRDDIARFEGNPAPALGVEERENLLNLKDAKPLPSITPPTIQFPDLVQLQLAAREALAKTVVSHVIEELAADPTVAGWVASGLPLHIQGGDADTCKFCKQPLPPARLRQLEAHFNDQFRQFTASLQTLAERIESASHAFDSVTLPSGTALYPELRASYERECRQLNVHLSEVGRALAALAGAVRTKQERVFERLELESLLSGGRGQDADSGLLAMLLKALNAGIGSIQEFQGKTALSRVHGLIQQHNEKTKSFTEEVRKARIRLHEHELADALPGWLDRTNTLEAAEAASTSARGTKSEAEADIKALEMDILEHRLNRPGNCGGCLV